MIRLGRTYRSRRTKQLKLARRQINSRKHPAYRSLPPEILEPRRRQFSVTHRMLDVTVAEVSLQRPSIAAICWPAHASRTGPRQEASNVGFTVLVHVGPDDCWTIAVRPGHHCYVRHIDPLAVQSHAVVTVLPVPINFGN